MIKSLTKGNNIPTFNLLPDSHLTRLFEGLRNLLDDNEIIIFADGRNYFVGIHDSVDTIDENGQDWSSKKTSVHGENFEGLADDSGPVAEEKSQSAD